MRIRLQKAAPSTLVFAATFAVGLSLWFQRPACAEDAPTFQIDMKDGVVTPQRLEVPAGKRILIEITNSGATPAEFESRDLKKEIGIFPGQKSTLVIKKLDPGEYAFFDDFHPGSVAAVLVAK